MGSSVSTAIMVTLWAHRGEQHHATLTENVTAARPATTQFLQQLTHSGMSPTRSLEVINQLLTREALTLSVNDVFLGCSILFVLLIPVLWFARPPFGSAGGAAVH
jgi:DHA2 family multidrug resistance protein